MSLKHVLSPRHSAKLPVLNQDGVNFPYVSSLAQPEVEPELPQERVKPTRPRLDEYIMPAKPVAPVQQQDDGSIKRAKNMAIAERIGEVAGALGNLASLRSNPRARVRPSETGLFSQQYHNMVANRDASYDAQLKDFAKRLSDYERLTTETGNKTIAERNKLAGQDYEQELKQYYASLNNEEKARVDKELEGFRQTNREKLQNMRQTGAMAQIRQRNAGQRTSAGKEPDDFQNLFTEVFDLESQLEQLDQDLIKNPPPTRMHSPDLPPDPRIAQRELLASRFSELTRGINPQTRNQYIGFRNTRRSEIERENNEKQTDANMTALQSLAAASKHIYQSLQGQVSAQDRNALIEQMNAIRSEIESKRADLIRLGYEKDEVEEYLNELFR